MREYELLYIVHPDREGDQLKEVVGKYSDVVSKQGGEVLKVEEWRKQKLAYPIGKCSKGQYVLMNYFAPATLTSELERLLRLDELVLKYLTIKVSDNPDQEKRRQEIAASKAKAEEQRVRAPAERTAASPGEAKSGADQKPGAPAPEAKSGADQKPDAPAPEAKSEAAEEAPGKSGVEAP